MDPSRASLSKIRALFKIFKRAGEASPLSPPATSCTPDISQMLHALLSVTLLEIGYLTNIPQR